MHVSTRLICGMIAGLLLPITAVAADYLEEARDYYDRQEYRAAVIQLKNALKEAPDNRDARLLLARIYLETGDAAAAEKEFRQARRLEAARADWVTGLAQSLLRQASFDEVLQEIEVTADDPAALAADIRVLRAQALMAQGELTQAEEQFRQALTLDDKHADAHLGLAQLAYNAGDHAQAHQLVDRALDSDRGSYSANLVKAQILAAEKRPEAVTWFDRALEARPDDIVARLGKAQALIVQGEFSAARPVVDELLEVLPENAQVTHLDGLLEFSAGNHDQALAAFNKVLSVQPKHAPAMLFLGTIHHQRGNLDQARLYLSDYLEYVPGHVPARQMLGSISLQRGEVKEAIEIMQPAAEAARDNAGYLAQLGAAYMQVGEVERAMEYLERAREIAPEALPVQAQLAMGRILQGDRETGLEELRVLTDAEGGMGYDRLLVMSYMALEDHAAALRAVEAMRNRYPDSAEAANLHAVVQLAMGERKAARQTLQQAIDADPAFSAAYINLANVEFQDGNAAAAADVLERAERQGAGSPGVLLARARLAEATGDRKGAADLYRQAYEGHENELQPGLAYADYLARNDELNKALVVLSDLDRRHPGQPRVLAKLGMVQINSGNHANAEATIKSLIEKTPENGYAYYLLGRLHLARNETGKAIAPMERALELGVEDIEARVLLTEAYAAQGQDDKALALIERTKEEYADVGLGFELEGDFHMRRQAPAEALEAYRQAYARSATRPLMTKLYRVHKTQGDAGSARTVLETWLQSYPDDTGVRLIYASDLGRAGESGAALEEYQAVLERQPDNVPALNNAAVIAAETDPERGLEYAARAYELSASRPEIIDTYGWLLLKNDRPVEAERLLKEAAVLAPHIPDIRYHLAAAYHRNGKNKAALLELREIERRFDELSRPEQARSLYQQLNSAD